MFAEKNHFKNCHFLSSINLRKVFSSLNGSSISPETAIRVDNENISLFPLLLDIMANLQREHDLHSTLIFIIFLKKICFLILWVGESSLNIIQMVEPHSMFAFVLTLIHDRMIIILFAIRNSLL